MKWRRLHWVLVALVFAITCYVIIKPPAPVPPAPVHESDETKALVQAEAIVYACVEYRDSPANPQRGKYPATLSELVNPPFGGPSFLRKGEQDLIDPWENLYHFEVGKGFNGEVEVRVCTVRVTDYAIILLGAERTADGTIRSFRTGS